MVKIYKQPFAHGGDTIAIPDASQPDGKISNVDGWTPDYQLPKTDPNYKPVGRQEMNGVFKEVTESLGQVQVQGAASWSADGAPYPINAQVYHGGKQWLALRANSVEPAEGADWTELVGKQYIDANLPDLAGYLQPSITGSCTTNGTTDNTLVLTGIVSALSLEAGDVIQITGSTGGLNDKLFTVETITDANSIIVNYEHAGNRCNGSLKLADQTANVTITRIAKWYNAPIGLGQAWVSVLGIRAEGVDYTNLNSRDISHSMLLMNTDVHTFTYRLGGILSDPISHSAGGSTTLISNPVPSGSSYGVTYTGSIMKGWLELR